MDTHKIENKVYFILIFTSIITLLFYNYTASKKDVFCNFLRNRLLKSIKVS